MSSRMTASALLGLVVMTAVAQPPASNSKPADKKPAEKKADPLDGLIGAALLHDADVKVAHAKLQLADAELAKARQAVTQKVIFLNAAIRDQKRVVDLASDVVKTVEERVRARADPWNSLIEAQGKLDVAKSKLAQQETELKLMTGGGTKAAAGWDDLGVEPDAERHSVAAALAWLAKNQAAGTPVEAARAQAAASLLALAGREPVKGPMADRIRAALDKPVKLGAKGARVEFDDALEVFKKDAGLDVPVRNGFRTSQVTSLGEELPVGAWFQMFADANPELRFVVREYGLLVTRKESAPPDAMTVTEFWKQKPAVKEPPKAVEGQPKK